jgi:hypothetical protein
VVVVAQAHSIGLMHLVVQVVADQVQMVSTLVHQVLVVMEVVAAAFPILTNLYLEVVAEVVL